MVQLVPTSLLGMPLGVSVVVQTSVGGGREGRRNYSYFYLYYGAGHRGNARQSGFRGDADLRAGDNVYFVIMF